MSVWTTSAKEARPCTRRDIFSSTSLTGDDLAAIKSPALNLRDAALSLPHLDLSHCVRHPTCPCCPWSCWTILHAFASSAHVSSFSTCAAAAMQEPGDDRLDTPGPQHKSLLATLLAGLGQQVPRSETDLSHLAQTLGTVPSRHRQYRTSPTIPTPAAEAVLGQGGFATVYKAVDEDGQEVAVKVMKQALPFPAFLREAEQWATELLAMSAADHPNVMKAYGWDVTEQAADTGDAAPGTGRKPASNLRLFRMRIFLPLMSGSCEDLSKCPDLQPQRLLRVMAQASAGLRHLHERVRLVHNDIKAANVLLDAAGNAVIADFGLSTFLPRAGTLVPAAPGHTPGYVAPERAGKVLRVASAGRPFACPASDMWALGVELARLYRRVPAAHRPAADPAAVAPLVRHVLAACFAPDPDLRLPASEMEEILTAAASGAGRLQAGRQALAACRRACGGPGGCTVQEATERIPVCLAALSVLGGSVAVSTIVFSSDDGGDGSGSDGGGASVQSSADCEVSSGGGSSSGGVAAPSARSAELRAAGEALPSASD